MIKRIAFGVGISLLLIIGIVVYYLSGTKKHSPAAEAALKNGQMELSVKYCRPYKKGRVIFGPENTGALQPFGRYWRVGANEATTFQTKTPILFNNNLLHPGKYALYAIPNAGEWTIAINTEHDRWGATAPDVENDVFRTQVPASDRADLQEQFLVSFIEHDGAVKLALHWDNTKVEIPIKSAQ